MKLIYMVTMNMYREILYIFISEDISINKLCVIEEIIKQLMKFRNDKATGISHIKICEIQLE